MPNILCSGSPGVGKTSAAIAIARKLCGSNFVELNASDNRGINMISDLVSSFCRATGSGLRIIILDEADNITKKAQQQLVNFMENYPRVRIIFTCNEFEQIIEPLQSRCMLMQFQKPKIAQATRVLERVFAEEGVEWDAKGIQHVLHYVGGDLRAAINTCQAVYVSNGKVTEEAAVAYLCLPSIPETYRLLTLSKEQAVDTYLELMRTGLSGLDIMSILIEGLQSETLPPPLEGLTRDRVFFILQKAHVTYYRMLQTVESTNQMVKFLYAISQT